MLAIEARLPLLTRIGILPLFMGAVLAMLAQLAGPEPAHPGIGMVQLGHLAIVVGMVLVMAGVGTVGIRRQLERRPGAVASGGPYSDAHR